MSKKNIEQIKNIIIIVLILIVVFGVSFYASELKGCNKSYGSLTNENSTTSSSSDIPVDEQADMEIIDIDKYLSLKKENEASIIYIARPTCGFCQEQEPIMKNIVYEYGITVNYLNTDELDDKGQAKLIKSDDYFSKGYGTPLTLIVKNDEIVVKKEGLTSKEELVTLFKENGFISE